MKFVGIRNCDEKFRLLKCPAVDLRPLVPADVAFDCQRHIDFLKRIDAGMTPVDFPESLYWQYLIWAGKGAAGALYKCEQFSALYKRIRVEGFDQQRGVPSVAFPNIRLDGSHRAAIAVQLGLSRILVAVHDWRGCIEENHAKLQIEEARIKVKAQSDGIIGRVASTLVGVVLGRIVFVDPRRSTSETAPASSAFNIYLGIQTVNGGLIDMPESEVHHD